MARRNKKTTSSAGAQYGTFQTGPGQYFRGLGSCTEAGLKEPAVPEHFSVEELRRSSAAVSRPNPRSNR